MEQKNACVTSEGDACTRRRLALGTVRFGMPYGIDNQADKIGRAEAESILTCAQELGFTTLDTAIAYGESEARLGEIGIDRWRVVSKLPDIPESCTNIFDWIQQSVIGSLRRLRCSSLYGLLLHNAHALAGSRGDAVFQALAALKERKLVQKVGVSIYAPDDLVALVPRFPLDLVQAPYNVMDRRLATSGWLPRLIDEGIEVHARSIFLQGLLLMTAASRPTYFSRWQPLWNLWHSWLNQQGITAVQACLGFVLRQPLFSQFIVGVDSVAHLREIAACVEVPTAAAPDALMSEDVDLINPSHWSIL